ncbi:MAG: hypothetical protein WC825_04785 [Gallionellaceae bacterium]|jgi:hypothetical protein
MLQTVKERSDALIANDQQQDLPYLMSELILYQTEDGKAEVRLRAEDGSVWLAQGEIAELFSTTKQNVSLHAANILKEGELIEGATVKDSLTVQIEGGRQVKRRTLRRWSSHQL